MLAAFQVARDLAEQPGYGLGGAADHDARRPRVSRAPASPPRASGCRRSRSRGIAPADFTSAIVSYFSAAAEGAGPRAAVDGKAAARPRIRRSAPRTGVRCSGRGPVRILSVTRDVSRGRQSRPGGFARPGPPFSRSAEPGAHVADLLSGRAAHVDCRRFGALVERCSARVGEHGRVSARRSALEWARLAGVVGGGRRLLRDSRSSGLRRQHLGDGPERAPKLNSGSRRTDDR